MTDVLVCCEFERLFEQSICLQLTADELVHAPGHCISFASTFHGSLTTSTHSAATQALLYTAPGIIIPFYFTATPCHSSLLRGTHTQNYSYCSYFHTDGAKRPVKRQWRGWVSGSVVGEYLVYWNSTGCYGTLFVSVAEAQARKC